jgi:hypothetical protein
VLNDQSVDEDQAIEEICRHQSKGSDKAN